MLGGLIFLTQTESLSIYATTKEEIEENREKIDELEKQQEENDERKDELKNSVNSYSDKVTAYSEQLSEASAELSSVEVRLQNKEGMIENLEDEIEKLQSELEELESEKDLKYEAMTLRIRYAYEHGSTGWLSILMESEGLADFINRVRYISSIASYDKGVIDQLELLAEQTKVTKVTIEGEMDDLEKEKAELTALQAEYEAKSEEMERLLDEAKENLRTSQSDLNEAKSEAADIKKQLKKMEKKQKKLEKEYAKAEAERLSEIEEEEEELKNTATYEKTPLSTSDSDLDLMTTIIYCEVRGESYKCQLAVGSVVANRVKSSQFPNTIKGVIYQSGQFSPVASGTFAYYLANPGTDNYDSCRKAAKKILSGVTTNDFLYFRSNASAQAAGITGTVIDDTTFY